MIYPLSDKIKKMSDKGFFYFEKGARHFVHSFSRYFFSCLQRSKKPVPPQNNTQIVPEVRTVNFEKINPKTAPKIIQDIAGALQNKDATSWANEGNQSYLIINQGESTRNYQLKVEQVLQKDTETDYTWLDVKLLYNKDTKNEPVERILDRDQSLCQQPAQGCSLFTISGLPFSEQALQTPASPPVKQPAPSASQTDNGAVIEQPSPNQQITIRSGTRKNHHHGTTNRNQNIYPHRTNH